MRIALITRSTLLSIPGGDTTQVLSTAKYLRRGGLEVDILRASDKVDHRSYHLLHFFNIIRPADILPHIRTGMPYVVSPIFVDYTEFDKKYRSGLSGLILKALSPGGAEYAKAIARYISRSDGLAGKEYLWLGHQRSIRNILQNADCILPNSENEYERLKQAFGIDKKYQVVPNGIDTEIFPLIHGTEKDRNMVVCAARVEGIKNQLNLIRALNDTRFKVYIIGNAAPNQRDYYAQCKSIAASNIVFLENLPQSELIEYYRKAQVHVLPSWFETTGLSSLEAAAMGCNIVISAKGDAKEYFGSDAFYCDPGSPGSIAKAVEDAATQPVSPSLEKKIRTKFTWEQAAFCTIQAYSHLHYANSNHRNQGHSQPLRRV